MQLSPDDPLSLDGKVALVTGASRGIGEAIAATFAGAGAKVMLTSRKQDALDRAAEGMDGEVATFAAHVGDDEDRQRVVDHTVERWGGVDILVNNAGTNPYFGPSIGIDRPRFDKTWDVNFTGALYLAQACYEAGMKDRPGASIINIASVGGMSVEPGIGIYNVTKAALIHLTRTLASELGPTIRVNAIAPGLVKTDLARALWEEHGEKIAKRWPTRRLGEPQDIANGALFLVSDLASWLTGHTLVIDGGALVAANSVS